MDDKLILDFLRSLHEHKDEGEQYLRMILSPTASSGGMDTSVPRDDENSLVMPEVSSDAEEESRETEAVVIESENASPDSEEGGTESDTLRLPADFSAHLGDSLKCLDGFLSGRRPSPDDWKGVFGLLFSIISEAADGVITPATAETLLRAVSYDRAVGIALHEGEVKGRNARIEEELLSPSKGDGVPSLRGTRGGYVPRRSQSIFDLAGEAR